MIMLNSKQSRSSNSPHDLYRPPLRYGMGRTFCRIFFLHQWFWPERDRGQRNGAQRLGASAIALFGLHCFSPSFSLPATWVSISPLSAQTLDSPDQLLEAGRAAFHSGNYSQAVLFWREATDGYERRGDRLRQAQALNNLALTYQHLGQWENGDRAIATSLELIQSTPEDLQHWRILAQTLSTQGTALMAQGQPDQAVPVFDWAIATYRKARDTDGEIQGRLNQAQALHEQGYSLRALEQLADVYRQHLHTAPDSPLKISGLRALGTLIPIAKDLDSTQTLLGVATTQELLANSDPNSFVALALGQSFVMGQELLEASLALAKDLKSPADISLGHLHLGNAYRNQQQALNSIGTEDSLAEAKIIGGQALEQYLMAAETTLSSTLRLQAQVNAFTVAVDLGEETSVQRFRAPILVSLNSVAPSRPVLNAKIQLAQSLLVWQSQQPTPSVEAIQTAVSLLTSTIQQARTLGDSRTESFALGALGKAYEQTQQWTEALQLTEQALLIAQSTNAQDLSYLGQWQLGRLLKQRRQFVTNPEEAVSLTTRAIAAYSEAASTLKKLRRDVITLNPEVQFAFRSSIEPFYRQYAGLLLEAADDPAVLQQLKEASPNSTISEAQETIESIQGGEKTRNSLILSARDAIEALRLEELINFLRVDCEVSRLRLIDEIDKEAVVIYPILLDDRLAVILSLPGEPLQHFSVPAPKATVEALVATLEKNLTSVQEPGSRDRTFLPQAQQLYDWLIRPLNPKLSQYKTQTGDPLKTLVFVLDGDLRKVPMAALHDGQQYLIERYGVALAPGLQLVDPQQPSRESFRILLGGVTQAVAVPNGRRFSALPNVNRELQQIQELLPRHTVLVNENLTASRVEKTLTDTPFSIVHFATHGQFSSIRDDTYLVAWRDRLDIDTIRKLLQDPALDFQTKIDLLVLSACQTASGDQRAALGLAGMAVSAGVRSTVASLWNVSDASAPRLMGRFYQELPQDTKAAALQRAQIDLLTSSEFSHPHFWSPFVLVGNWL